MEMTLENQKQEALNQLPHSKYHCFLDGNILNILNQEDVDRLIHMLSHISLLVCPVCHQVYIVNKSNHKTSVEFYEINKSQPITTENNSIP